MTSADERPETAPSRGRVASRVTPLDEIQERYLRRAISEVNELGDELLALGDELHVPVLGSGHPLGDVFLLKHRPTPSEIPRGMTFADTVAAIREQQGVVYVPHPFDRMHSIPAPATLHGHLPEIDVLEVYNARLLFDAYNDEALRFARKYGLLAGAGSDAHVLQGVGTGALRMRRFDGPEEFLLSLRTATVRRRPKSLAYLQSLKWVAQVRERVGDRR